MQYEYCQPYNERTKSTGSRRLSSPIFNPNFEEDFDVTLMTPMNRDDVLASLSGVTLTSSSGNDELQDIVQREPVNHDDSLNGDGAAEERDEVVIQQYIVKKKDGERSR